MTEVLEPARIQARVPRPPRAAGLAAALAALVLVTVASVVVGTKQIPLGTVYDALIHYTGTPDEIVVRGQRVPRTLLGLCAGAALGLAGALMQALTRNPLADPGLLGVDAGAGAATVAAIGLFGLSSPSQYVWAAFAGAGLVAAAVQLLGSRGPAGAAPTRLVLAGAALSAVCAAFVSTMLLTDPQTFDAYRFWQVGSLSGRGLDVLGPLLPFFGLGTVLALGLARPLNALALGADTGRALGVHQARTTALGMTAVVLLCGAATAACGPIMFIGLAVPHIARALVGPDHRWMLPYCLVLAPTLLIGADVVGRLVVRPGELSAGFVTAFLGAPVLIALVRAGRAVRL